MKTLPEFEYDLWAITENDEKRFYARVKASGEVTEISIDVMRYLFSCDKAMRRKKKENMEFEDRHGKTLSLDYITTLGDADIQCPAFLEDHNQSVEDIVVTQMLEDTLLDSLTERQKDVYISCIWGDSSLRAYSKNRGINFNAALGFQNGIRKKAERIF